MKIKYIGYNFTHKEKFGLEVCEITEADLLSCYDSIEDSAVEAEYASEKEAYAFNGDEASLKNNIKQYLALKKFFNALCF